MCKKIILLLLNLIIYLSVYGLDDTSAHRAIILYSSDTPNEFIYFSTFFTDYLNKKNSFHAIHQHNINDLWIQNFKARDKNKFKNFESKLSKMISSLKFNYKNKAYQNLGMLSVKYQDEFYYAVANYPLTIRSDLLAEFFFWNGIAEIITRKHHKYSLFAYLKYATIIEKNLFAQELDPSTLTLLSNYSLAKQKTIQIRNKNNCQLYLNGYRLNKSFVILPGALQSAIFAQCPTGSFGEIFLPENKKLISIDQLNDPAQVLQMPSILDLPIAKIQAENISEIILFFWSKKNNFLEVKLINSSHVPFRESKKIKFNLRHGNDLSDMSEQISNFIGVD